MRKIIRPEINKYRVRNGPYKSDNTLGYTGAFCIPKKEYPNTVFTVIACENFDGGWDHVSVSLETRCPIWDEMCYIKDLFWDEEELIIQFHPPKSKHRSYHPYCLHMWKTPQKIELPKEYTI